MLIVNTFMDTSSYEQIDLEPDVVGDAIQYLIENMEILLFFNDHHWSEFAQLCCPSSGRDRPGEKAIR